MALALYRKYRPRTFAEVIGQEHVTEPLSQALRSGRLNHAYLFSGPRGCGKTSSARILARSLNCEQGPTPEPCGQCLSCRSLMNDGAGSIDVIEIDAASHGGVDDARELREKAFFAPANSRYKIYVIDEAHMVSSAGFNALLKLVEEPPEYVKFIFATTEPEKVLGTIKSRTHHYPFRLIPPSILRPYLEQLTEAEGVTVEAPVFPLVVRAGGGSARDTLSVLDQLIAGAGEEGVTYARAVALLGVTDSALIDDMIESLAASDGAAAYAAIDRVAEAGHDPRRFATDLLERFRDLIVMQQVPDAAAKGLIDGPADEIERMTAQAGRFGAATLSRAADIVHNGLVEMRGTTGPRLLLELITARMLLPGADDSSSALLQRLERMERALQDPSGVRLQPAPGAAAPAPMAPAMPGPSTASAPPVAHAASNDAGFDARAAARQAAARRSGNAASATRPAAAQATAPAPGRLPAAPGAGQVDPASQPGAVVQPGPEALAGVPAGTPQTSAPQADPAPAAAQAGPSPSPAVQAPAAAPEPQPGPSQTGAAPSQPVPAEAPTSGAPAATEGPDVSELRSRWWPEAFAFVNTRSKRAGAMLRHATVRAVDGDTLVLTFQHPKHIDLFAGTPEESLLREAFYELFGVRWKVRCEPSGAAGALDVPVARPNGRTPATPRQPAPQPSSGHTAPPTAPARSLSETDPRSGPDPGPPSASLTAAEDAGWPTPAAIPSTPGHPAEAPAQPSPAQPDAKAAQPDAEERRPTPAQRADAPSGTAWPHPAQPGGTATPAADEGWPSPVQPGGGTVPGNSSPAPAQPASAPSPADNGSRPQSAQPGGTPGPADNAGWPQPVQPGDTPSPIDNGGWPEPVQPGGASGPIDNGGWPEPVQPGGAPSPADDSGWPEPVPAGRGGDLPTPGAAAAAPVSPAPAAAESAPRSAAGGLAAARAAAAGLRGKQAPPSNSSSPSGDGQRGPVAVRPAESPAPAGGGSAWDDFPEDEEPPYDPDYDGPLPKGGGPVAVGGTSQFRAESAGIGTAARGEPAAPVSGGPVAPAPVSAAPYSGAAAVASATPVSAAPVSSAPGPAASAPAGPAAQSGSARNPALASAKAAASRAAANAASGRSAQAKPAAAPAAEQARPTHGRAAAAVAAANAAAAAAAAAQAAQANQPVDPSANEFEGFDPGDEPLDEVVDEQAARQSSEQQAIMLLKQAFGAEKITEM